MFRSKQGNVGKGKKGTKKRKACRGRGSHILVCESLLRYHLGRGYDGGSPLPCTARSFRTSWARALSLAHDMSHLVQIPPFKIREPGCSGRVSVRQNAPSASAAMTAAVHAPNRRANSSKIWGVISSELLPCTFHSTPARS